MRQFFRRLWCRWRGHNPHHEPLKPVHNDLYIGGISSYVFTAPYCKRCGATDLYGWVMIKGYMEKTDGNADALKGPRP